MTSSASDEGRWASATAVHRLADDHAAGRRRSRPATRQLDAVDRRRSSGAVTAAVLAGQLGVVRRCATAVPSARDGPDQERAARTGRPGSPAGARSRRPPAAPPGPPAAVEVDASSRRWSTSRGQVAA